mgnify:FL=1
MVQLEVSAHGRIARDEWPRLQVRLAGRELGEMEVASSKTMSHTFLTRVLTGKHRLEVRLVEGFWSSKGEHRWARLDTVTLSYSTTMAP